MKPFLEKRAPYIFLLVTIVVTTYFHFWRLPDFPIAISGDEAKNGLEVLLLMAEPELIIFAPSNAGREALFHYMLMVPITIFGPNVFALRLIPTLASVLIVPLSYRWLTALLPPSRYRGWIGVLTAIFVATSLWSLQLSRLGLRGVLLIPCMLAAYYFFWAGYRRKKYTWFGLSGVFLGLATHIYTASRSLPLAFILLTLCILVFYRKQEAERLGVAWRGLLITGLVSMIVFAPLGWYFLNHPNAFLFRSTQVSLESIYQEFHAHTGESFFQFLLRSWVEHGRWFIEISTPWLQNEQLPSVIRWFPLLFWIGLLRVIMLTPRSVGYAFLLISFFLGMLPILIGLPTTMRVILGLPATYALLAIGLYTPLEYLLEKRNSVALPVNVTVALSVLIISIIATFGLFRPQFWVGAPPLPTPFDHGFDLAARRINTLVVDDKQTVLVPQAVHSFPPAQYLLQEDFVSQLPVEDQTLLAPTETLSIFWPVGWQEWFNNQLPSFVLLSPAADGDRGYIETIGQWEQTKWADFEALLETQLSRNEAEVVVDSTGRAIGHIFQAPRAQVLSSLRSTPQNPVRLDFDGEMKLLGYDVRFLSEQRLDIGLFWQAQRNILEDQILLLQVVDSQGHVQGETLGAFVSPVATWVPGQLMIDHRLIDVSEKLQPGVYTLKAGLIKGNYKDTVLSTYGEWRSVFDDNGEALSEPVVPLGLIQVGEPPTFDSTLDVTFDDQLRLTGYHLEPGPTPDNFRVSLRWEALRPLDKDYTITLQLLDGNQALVAQVDKPPLGGSYPTQVWPVQEPIPDTYALRLPEELESGIYHLAVGLYDFETLERLPVSQADSPIVDDTLVIIHKISLNSGMEMTRQE